MPGYVVVPTICSLCLGYIITALLSVVFKVSNAWVIRTVKEAMLVEAKVEYYGLKSEQA
jgi:hypothetical protein